MDFKETEGVQRNSTTNYKAFIQRKHKPSLFRKKLLCTDKEKASKNLYGDD
jgi:hypothetical protein